MSAPTVDQLNAHLADIDQATRTVRDLYRWAHPNVGSLPRHGGQERVDGGGERDTSDLVVANRYYNDRVQHAARAVDRARSDLLGAVGALNDAMATLEPPASVERHERTIERPAKVAEIKQAKKYQARRAARAAMKRTPWSDSEITG